jgi:transposase
MSDVHEKVKRKYDLLSPYLNERSRRVWAAVEAEALGEGGVRIVAQATLLSRTTISAGVKELSVTRSPTEATGSRTQIRKAGGGRKHLTAQDVTLMADLEALVDPVTRGDPTCPLRWTCKSTTKLAEELGRQGHHLTQRTVCTLLHTLGYSLQAPRKVKEGGGHPDRDAQFAYISQMVTAFQAQGNPVISVDAKKKELLGEFKPVGQEWQPHGHPLEVNVYDFPTAAAGKVVPYGVYDVTANSGWVSVGITHDTAEFAVASIRQWWHEMGRSLYPTATRLLITADCGGSNGRRVRLWKWELQRLANELALEISICHFPPGTSKWNKIEHRMFCHITQNWRGQPLTSREVVVNLISNTTTSQGLEIVAKLDIHSYPLKVKVSKEAFQSIVLKPGDFHGEWNYTICPQTSS